MSDCKWTLLRDRAVLRVGGADAQNFLQGLITNDVEKIGAAGAVHSALLTPQGKILFDFFVIADVEGFLLEAPREHVGNLLKRLSFYKLRADVSFEDLETTHEVAAQWGGPCPPLDHGFSFEDPRLGALGVRIIAEKEDGALTLPGCLKVPEEEYHAHRIALGVPEGGRDYLYEDTFPHEANFDLLAGVAFEKGCYVGQEVVSRMQHRGTARKRIVCVAALKGDLESGAEIAADGHAIGALGSVSDGNGLGLVRVDRAKEALEAGTPIQAGSVTVRLTSPGYADFELPES